MEGRGEYSSVTIGTFVFKHDWIFNPADMTIAVSKDGKEFTDVASAVYETIPSYETGNGRQEYTLEFPATDARFIRVTANTVTPIPEWHTGSGKPGFLFVDEIIVK